MRRLGAFGSFGDPPLDETAISSDLIGRPARRGWLRLPRLPNVRIPLPRLGRADEAATRPLIATYRRPPMSRMTAIALLAAVGVGFLAYGYWFAALAPRLMLPFFVPPALISVLLIWALPAGDYAPTKTMAGLFWGFFISLVLWPNYLAIALPGLPWVTLIRLTGGPLVAVLLVCVSVSKPFREKCAEILNDSPFIWKSLMLYVAIAVLTLPLSREIGGTINKFIVFLITQLAVFFVSAFVFSKAKRLETWVYILLGMDVILCAIGFWEARLGFVPWAGHIPSFLAIEDPTVTRILSGAARAATGIHRVQAVATTSLGLAEVLGLSAPFVLHIGLGRYPVWMRIPALVFIPVLIQVIILTDARLGFVSMLVAGSLYLLLRALVQWREVKSSIFGPAIVLTYPAIFCALVASTFLIGKLRARVWGDGSQAASTEARKGQWAHAIPKIASNPIGHGYGTASDVLGWTNLAGSPTIDSYYLNLMLDTGLLGFIAYLALFLGSSTIASLTVIRHPGSRETRLLMPLAVIMPAFIVVKGVLSQDANHPLLFMMLGAIVALVHRIRVREREAEAQAKAAFSAA